MLTEAEQRKLELALQLIQEVLGGGINLGITKQLKNNNFEVETNEKSGYHTDNIRDLLTSGFSESEVRRLIQDNPSFREIKSAIANLSSIGMIVDVLIDEAIRRLLMETVLGWAKHNNPNRYETHKPYRVK